jgi:hypothetical protein
VGGVGGVELRVCWWAGDCGVCVDEFGCVSIYLLESVPCCAGLTLFLACTMFGSSI